MELEDFSVSDECFHSLQRVGFTKVEEIAQFLESYQFGSMVEAKWMRYFDEIVAQLKALKLWSPEMERKWPDE